MAQMDFAEASHSEASSATLSRRKRPLDRKPSWIPDGFSEHSRGTRTLQASNSPAYVSQLRRRACFAGAGHPLQGTGGFGFDLLEILEGPGQPHLPKGPKTKRLSFGGQGSQKVGIGQVSSLTKHGGAISKCNACPSKDRDVVTSQARGS